MVLLGCWKQRCDGNNRLAVKGVVSVFLPKTTWTTGRNALISHALALESAQGYLFEYWAFLDADVTLKPPRSKRGRYCQVGNKRAPSEYKCDGVGRRPKDPRACQRVLERMALAELPALLVPIVNWVGVGKGLLSSTAYTDGMYSMMHRLAVDLLLPYTAEYDHVSWWISQQGVVYTGLCVAGAVLQANCIAGVNGGHHFYPRGHGGEDALGLQLVREHTLPPSLIAGMPPMQRNPPAWKAVQIPPFSPTWEGGPFSRLTGIAGRDGGAMDEAKLWWAGRGAMCRVHE